ncbi:enoyl-CoA hydratase-related protein [Sphingomonas oligophenolica]|uniref:Enoyl-CoA hydratase/isomerase family protein n=1 Tax=Sphingomonas oligophenolica TaxID=301154 RepID=A0ABU9Y9Y6_9SPHN
MEPDLLRIEHGPILEVVFNRPKKYNAMNRAIGNGLSSAVAELRDRRDLRVMLIRANGKYFSAGADLTDITRPDAHGSSSAERSWYRQGEGSFHPLFDEMEAVEKPIVVAHQGPCFGGSFEMSLSCDFRLGAASATYRMPEIDIGCLPGSGGTSRLTRLLGPHWARWFVLAGETASANQALNMGLLHDVYPDDEFDERVMKFCAKLASLPPEAVALSKLTIELAADLDRQQARNVERLSNSILFLGDEHKDLIAAMIQRLSKKA